MTTNFVRDVKEVGMDPERQFDFSSNVESDTILPMDGGRAEVIEFDERSNNASFTSWDTAVGIGPETRLRDRSSVLRVVNVPTTEDKVP